MPLTYSQHANDRMNQRGITMAFVEATVNGGNYRLQAHGTRLYSAVYSYQVVIPTLMVQPVTDQFGNQIFDYNIFDYNWVPMLQTVMVPVLNTRTYTLYVVTDAAGTLVVTAFY